MLIKILKLFVEVLISIFAILILIFSGLYIWTYFSKPANNLNFGVTFSKSYAQQFGLDWKKTYIDILDDLKIRKLRLSAYWSEIEPQPKRFDFNNLDFQIREAEKRNAEIILAVGIKLPRWPECHQPKWVKPENLEKELLSYIKEVILRYKSSKVIKYWQIENEPFFTSFGICPDMPEGLLDKEIDLVRSLDSRPVIITDSGEWGDWVRARKRADIFGTTIYRIVWNDVWGRIKYPFPAKFYMLKNYISSILSGKGINQQKVIVAELQAEAWGYKPIPFLELEEQKEALNFKEFKEIFNYIRKTGFNEVYLYGVEWWYWLKEKQNDSRFWDFVKNLAT